jgi:hypothetical protein
MANYKEIREQFIKLSGRYDLVTETTNWTDNGANWYIKAGLRMLDQMVPDYPKQIGRYFETVAAGTYYITFEGCRQIKEVWAALASDKRWLVLPMDPLEFYGTYDEPFGDATQGEPSYYTRAHLRGIPDFSTIDNISGYAEEIAEDTSQMVTNGIVFMPPADQEMQIEVWGVFDTYELSAETDANWWTTKHEDLVVMAALYKLEVSNRNREGSADWMAEIHRMIVEIDMDEVAEDANNAEEMSG